MMLQATPEQQKLHEELMKTKDPERIKEINERLLEILHEREEQLKDCPFVH